MFLENKVYTKRLDNELQICNMNKKVTPVGEKAGLKIA